MGIWKILPWCAACSPRVIVGAILIVLRSGYTIGYTTPPFEYSSSEPTIVELLTYWVAMALTPDSKYGICKQVCGEPPFVPCSRPCTVYDILPAGGKPAFALYLL